MSGHQVRADSGSVTLELAILGPALLLLLGLVVAAGRIEVAGAAVEQAASAAAREASIARSAPAARAAATSSARQSLREQGIDCAGLDVTVDTAGFAVAAGLPARVDVSVVCSVPLSDLAVPGLPGSRTMRAQMASPLDRYRSR